MATDLVSDVGFGVIKSSSRFIFGSGKAVFGVVTEDEDLIADGLESMGAGAMGIGSSLLRKTLSEDDSCEDDVFSLSDD